MSTASASTGSTLPATGGECLRVKGLHKTYALGRLKVPVLRGVDFAANEGEFVAILGASGSGKSTLLHLIGGLDTPDRSPAGGACSIQYRGEDLVGKGRARLDRYRARDTGFVFQFYHLLPELTVLENVTVAAMVRWGLQYPQKRAEVLAAANELIKQVGLEHRRGHRPAELSGGERQRVAIARALINQPTLLLADEPTGNLDRATGDSILEMLLAIRASRQLTMIVVTHDENTARRADRIVRLVDGRVVGESR